MWKRNLCSHKCEVKKLYLSKKLDSVDPKLLKSIKTNNGRVTTFMLTHDVALVNKFKFIHDRQFSFRRNMSTNDAIAAITEEICKSIEHRQPTNCVFLDFDKVDRIQLLSLYI